MPKHRHQEWIRFLNVIKRNAPTDQAIHIICDNYATHKHPKVIAWLTRNPRFHVHFTPTSASWLNMGRDLLRHHYPPGHPPRQLHQRSKT